VFGNPAGWLASDRSSVVMYSPDSSTNTTWSRDVIDVWNPTGRQSTILGTGRVPSPNEAHRLCRNVSGQGRKNDGADREHEQPGGQVPPDRYRG